MEDPEASPRDEGGVGLTGAHGGAAVPDDPPECAVWAMGLPADAVGPVEWWSPKRLRPYAPRHVGLPSFRDTPPWRMLRHLLKESGVREPFLILPDGQVVDGVHRLELARSLGLAEVPVRVLRMPARLGDDDRLRLETTVSVLDAGRRHVSQSRIQGLLFGVTQAELAAGVVNSRVANLRRGRTPGSGAELPTQRALAESKGVSDRTIRRLTRVAREAPGELRSALASGAMSVRQADRRLATGKKASLLPNGPMAVRDLPMGSIGSAERSARAEGTEASPEGSARSSPDATPGTGRPSRAEAPVGSLGHAPPNPAVPAAPPASVQAFLALARELDEITERFLRDTAKWTGERREQRRLTVWQTVRHLSDQLEWMQAAEAVHARGSA